MSEFNEDSNYNDFMTMDNEETLATRSVSNSIPIYTRLNNPYTLEVMQKIYNDYSIEPVTLEPTDLYVCFMPQDTSQFRVLMDNDELDLYDYPLDVVLDEGQEYVNPELGEGWKPLTKLGKRVGDPYRITVTLDTTDTIQERLVALTMVNYRQMMANFDFRRIDVSLVYAGQDTLKINAGSPSNIELPELYNYIHEETVYDPVDSEVEDYPRYVTYTTKSYGYYTMKYPDDVCSWH